ncbi:hypothetical protein OM416_19555 [Paenibacillus sp. LS1]|nr:hypothetical protein [Paenibacillus sp. LS1]
MKKEGLISLDAIKTVGVLKDVLKAQIDDAHEQIQALAYKTDSESNIQRITYTARIELATNLLTRCSD